MVAYTKPQNRKKEESEQLRREFPTEEQPHSPLPKTHATEK